MARTNTANPRKRSAATRQNLLEAAAEVFVECGYDGTTLAAVAHRASVTTGAIYSNFEGKESLLCEVLRTRLTRQNDEFKTALLAALDVDPVDHLARHRGCGAGQVADACAASRGLRGGSTESDHPSDVE